MSQDSRFKVYWRRNAWLISCLLLFWFVITFVPLFFARSLGQIYLFGWPFSFWMAAFGGPTLFLLIVGFYAWMMDREDDRLRDEIARSESVDD